MPKQLLLFSPKDYPAAIRLSDTSEHGSDRYMNVRAEHAFSLMEHVFRAQYGHALMSKEGIDTDAKSFFADCELWVPELVRPVHPRVQIARYMYEWEKDEDDSEEDEWIYDSNAQISENLRVEMRRLRKVMFGVTQDL